MAKFTTKRGLRKMDKFKFIKGKGNYWIEIINKKENNELLIANFKIRIVAHIKVCLKDGSVIQRVRVSGTNIDGKKLPSAVVDAEIFWSFTWLHKAWGIKQEIISGKQERKFFKESVNYYGKKAVDETIVAYPGYYKLGNELIFLAHNTAISINDTKGKVSCELPSHFTNYSLPKPTLDEAKAIKCLKATLLLLKISKENQALGIVLIATLFRAVLSHAKRPDFSLFMVGRTGSFKSSIAGLILAFYGKNFNLDNLTASWGSTENANEHLLNALNHVVFVIDDFKYKNQNMIKKVNDEADGIFRNVANGTSRMRQPDLASGKEVSVPRVMLLATGEVVPINADTSMEARIVFMDLYPDQSNEARLNKLYKLGRQGVLAQAMSNFIYYYINNAEELKQKFSSDISKYTREVEQKSKVTHRRVHTNVAQLVSSYKAFLRYALSTKCIDADYARKLSSIGKKELIDLANRQNKITSELGIQNAISEAFERALRDSEIRFNPIECQSKGPEESTNEALVIGWRDEGSDITYVCKNFDPQLIEKHILKEVKGVIPMTISKFWKLMKKLGMLEDTGSDRNTIRKKIRGKERTVYAVRLRLRNNV
jgi:hypothetical protein